MVVQHINNIITQIKNSLDGKNATMVLEELGTRLHRVIYDHLLQFQYNTAGKFFFLKIVVITADYRFFFKYLFT